MGEVSEAWWAIVSFFGSLPPPNWDLILRFTEALAWPVVAVGAMIALRPGRIIDRLLADGGEIVSPIGGIKLARTIEEVAETVAEEARESGDANGELETEVGNPLAEAGDPYTTVMNGWGRVLIGIEEAAKAGGLSAINKMKPMETVTALKERGVISTRTANSVKRLLDVRNRVKSAGSRRPAVNEASANEYYEAAERTRRNLRRAANLHRATAFQAQGPNGSVTPTAH
jgi:hypothetical protein